MKTKQTKSRRCAVRAGSTLLRALRTHRANMAPHQRDREQGRLLLASIDRIELLEAALTSARCFWYGTTGEGEPGLSHAQHRTAAAQVLREIDAALDQPNAPDQP